MGDTRRWIVQILKPNISCNDLMKVGEAIALDQSLTEDNKFILRQLWQAKYKICEVDEGLMDAK